MSFLSNNSGSSAPIPIPKAKPSMESWFAAQIECYREPLDFLFSELDFFMNEPFTDVVKEKVYRELQNKDSNILKALLYLYDVIKTKCEIREEIVIVRYSEIPVIQTLEEITKDLFDVERYFKNPIKTRKDSIERIDFLDNLAKNIVFIYEKKVILDSFMRRVFDTNNNANINNNRRKYSNISNTTNASQNQIHENFLFEGGKLRKTRNKHRRLRKTRRS